MTEDAVQKDRRTGAGRRVLDKMEKRLKALEATVVTIGGQIDTHVVECSKNHLNSVKSFDELKGEVAKAVAWAQPQIDKARAKAQTWERVKNTVQTDWMIALLKYGPPLIMLALLATVFPAARSLILVVLQAAAKAMAGV